MSLYGPEVGGKGSDDGSNSSTNWTVESPLAEASITSFTFSRWKVAWAGAASTAHAESSARTTRALHVPIAGDYARDGESGERQRARRSGRRYRPGRGGLTAPRTGVPRTYGLANQPH